MRDHSRRPIEPRDFGPMSNLVLTIDAGIWRALRSGERFPVIVFREAIRGGVVDMRLNMNDQKTLIRIYGSLRQSVGEFCVLEIRETAFGRDVRRPHVRVARPDTWRRALPEVMPVTMRGDAPLRGDPFPEPSDTHDAQTEDNGGLSHGDADIPPAAPAPAGSSVAGNADHDGRAQG
jgi:hypothetical protein